MKRDKPFKMRAALGKPKLPVFFLLKALSCKDISAKDKKICNTKIWKYGTVVL